MGLFSKIKQGLKKTRESIVTQIDFIFVSFRKIDEELLEELEEILILSDVGAYTSSEICEELRKKIKLEKIKDGRDAKKALKEIVKNMVSKDTVGMGDEIEQNSKLSVILVVGVNGVGKTTTIGKLAHRFKKEGKRVILSAADTFRAAAIDQLEIWSKKAGVDIVKQNEGSDSAAVVYDSLSSAKAKNADVVICDTAGRLHNKKHLMAELVKINKVVNRETPNAKIDVLLVIDATTGQNAVNQAKEFKDAVGITGIVLTKLDGTAKGGVILAISNELDLPIRFIGVGEKIEDLELFDAYSFSEALLGQEG